VIASEIRQEARERLQGLWTNLIPIWFIYFLIIGGAPGIFGERGAFLAWMINMAIGGPLAMSMTLIFLRIYKQEPFELGQVLEGFKQFSRAFTTYLLIAIYVFLWMLLLIVPGIIAALGYTMTFFIMAENPEMPATEAMRRSKQMMFGHKWELFNLGLSFLGWLIVSALTFGIGLLWLQSYVMASVTIFYHKIKGQQEEIIEVKDEKL